MSCKVVFFSSASKEIQDSFFWYENRVNGLGVRFVNFIDQTIEMIQNHPDGFPNKKGPDREATMKTFPYQIIYEYIKEMQTIYILHVYHTKRHPKLKYKDL